LAVLDEPLPVGQAVSLKPGPCQGVLTQREQQLTERQQQLQVDMHLREQHVAEQQHQLLQQHAGMHLREKQVAEQQHQLQLQQQLNRPQQQLEAQSGAELQRQVQQQLAALQHLLQQQQADQQAVTPPSAPTPGHNTHAFSAGKGIAHPWAAILSCGGCPPTPIAGN
ncbi:hypothetical protein HaLaN_30921, partial [Haematococcus lacustris]